MSRPHASRSAKTSLDDSAATSGMVVADSGPDGDRRAAGASCPPGADLSTLAQHVRRARWRITRASALGANARGKTISSADCVWWLFHDDEGAPGTRDVWWQNKKKKNHKKQQQCCKHTNKNSPHKPRRNSSLLRRVDGCPTRQNGFVTDEGAQSMARDSGAVSSK